MQQNNIRYTLDELYNWSTGIYATRRGSELDLTSYNAIEGITVEYLQPEGSGLYVLFQVGGQWSKLKSDGTLQVLSNQTLTIENLEANGNTPGELRVQNKFAGLEKQKIGIAIGLSTIDILNATPRIKISFRVKTTRQVLTYSEVSPILELSGKGILTRITHEPTSSSGGSVMLTARGIKQDGTQIDYTNPQQLIGEKLKELQLKAEYTVTRIGEYVRLGKADITYSTGTSATTGLKSSEIVSQTYDWYLNIKQARMTIKHEALRDAGIKAYCALRERPKEARDEILGVGTGMRTTYKLAHTGGLKYDTIKVKYDGVIQNSGIEYNTQGARVTCTAPEGAIITCSYEYDWGVEEWQEMKQYSKYEQDEVETTEYRYATSETGKSVAAVKLELCMTSGHIDNEALGVGTGILQTYQLSHKLRDTNISVSSNGIKQSTSNWSVSSDPRYIRIAGNVGSRITATYDWISETPIIYQIAAVFGE